MLKGVEEVCFIDSFVVDKKDFLKAYRISPESGKLFMYDAYFENSNSKGGTVYETELGNKIYYSELQKTVRSTSYRAIKCLMNGVKAICCRAVSTNP